MITSWQEMEELALEYGFLPFFNCGIKGFSVEENTPSHLWFSPVEPGPWEWKKDAALNGRVVYGKFFNHRAGFISLRWFPDFANYRRDGYDLDALYDEGRVPMHDRAVYDMIVKHHALDTKALKAYCGFGKDGLKGFEPIIDRLQMQTYVNIRTFLYPLDRNGKEYGWGIAQYTTPEEMFGQKRVTAAYRRTPEESRMRILKHLRKKLPQASERQLNKLIG